MKKINLIFAMVFLTLSPCNHTIADSDKDQDIYQLGEISVTPGRFSIDVIAPSPYIIPKSQMEKLPLIDNDIFRSAHSLPGVVSDDFSARFSLRGGDRDETLLRLDGMELYDPYHLQDFGGAISVIDMGIVRHADLLTGGFPAEYGDAMSGVFDVATEEGNRGKLGGDAGIDLINAHLILNSPISRTSWLMSARRGYIDLLMGLMESDEVFKPQYYDIYNKLSYNVSPADNISAHILYAGDSNEIDRIGAGNDIRSKYWNGLLWARWNHLRSETAFWNMYLFSGRAGRQKYEGVDGVDERSMSYAGLKSDFTYIPPASQILKAGLRWQIAEASYNYYLKENESATSVNTSPHGWDLSGYIQDDWRVSDWLGGNLGLRCIYQSYGGYFNVMPRTAVAVKPRKDLIIRGAWGLYDQPVQVTNVPVEEGVSKSHTPEKAAHYILSVEYSPIASLLLRSEGYYKVFDNLAGQIKDYGRKENVFISPESGTARGIELYTRHAPLPRFSWSLGYALSRSEIKTEVGTINRNSDRRHSLSLSADYAIWVDGWINIAWRYHSGEPYTEAWYEKSASGDWEKKYGKINEKIYPSYHSLDARLTKNYQFKRWRMSLYFQVMNLYNKKNVQEYAFEQITDAEGKTSYQKVTENFLPILPTLGVSAQF